MTKAKAKISKKKVRLPKREMLRWLKERAEWNHEDWLYLLDNLRAQGFAEYTDNEEGQIALGQYLEENRKK